MERWDADRAAMLALPPVAPVTGWRAATRLPRDHYIRLDSNDYSVHPAAVGRRVEVAADLATVTVHCQGVVVASHARCWARHQTITDPAHVKAGDTARAEHRAATAAAAGPPGAGEVERRCLADYDDAFGLGDLADYGDRPGQGGEVA